MRVLAAMLLVVTACSSGTGGTTDCVDAGNCPCTAGQRCGAGQTCKVDQGWRSLDCACVGGAYGCGFTVKDAGPCAPGEYCNKGTPRCEGETASCRHDCRCEFTTTPTQGVWLCADNCGAAKDCPKAAVDAGTPCALASSVTCRYWGELDTQLACSCSSADAGTLRCN